MEYGRELPVYTKAQVLEHRYEEDLWIIVNNKVYNISNFPQAHPGGIEVLMDVAGTDATKDFYAVMQHGTRAREILKRNLIGKLIESEHTKHDVIDLSDTNRVSVEERKGRCVFIAFFITTILFSSFFTYRYCRNHFAPS